MTPSDTSRWMCPECRSLDVQVSYPTWYRETQDYRTTFIETDEGAEPLWWFCNDCQESGDGSPLETISD